MKKLQLTDAVAAKAGMTKKEAAAAVDAVLEVIAETLAQGEDVKITGFGSFEVKDRAAREGRNPRQARRLLFPHPSTLHSLQAAHLRKK